MRKAAAFLGALTIAGFAAVGVSAQTARTAPSQGGPPRTGETRQRPDNPACAELPELRRELERLQHELRRLNEALADAKRAGNRELAERIAHQIRRVQAEIQHVQHQIRRLQQECRGR
jgi:uncharacterized protein YukE